ncbi:MAG: hypothetical protein JWM99_1145, partial [Verrucomicrobiales bacterium]|nr:hypothetical protein [Verrucomicrobiales bacterium]
SLRFQARASTRSRLKNQDSLKKTETRSAGLETEYAKLILIAPEGLQGTNSRSSHGVTKAWKAEGARFCRGDRSTFERMRVLRLTSHVCGDYTLRVVLGAQTRGPWRMIRSTLIDRIHAAS